MRQIGRRVMQLAAGSALLIGLGSAGSAHAATTATCEAYASSPVREGSLVTSIHAISCNGYVRSVTIAAELSGPGGSVNQQRSCFNCAGISFKLTAPYVAGAWEAHTTGFGSPWGDDTAWSSSVIP